MFEISDNNELKLTEGAKIRVVGVGGGGCNAVNTMIKAGLTGVEYIVANTDSQALSVNLAPTKVQLGVELTKGLGAGANPEVGRKAALDEYEMLSQVLEGSDMVFITAGMGGGTGTGAAPVIAKLARELGALTVGVVTKPFIFEGRKRMRHAKTGIQTLEENVDSLITIPNQRLLQLAGESLSLVETFMKADEVLLNAVRGISDLINTTGHINADFADVSTVMSNKGLALMGTGLCSGPDRAIKAANEAISSPLLEDISIDGATGIIINITGGSGMTMHEVNEAATLIMEAADEDAEVIFGSVVDEELEDDIKVTVIATGLGGEDSSTRVAPQQEMRRPVQTEAPQAFAKPIVEERTVEVKQEQKVEQPIEHRTETISRPAYYESTPQQDENLDAMREIQMEAQRESVNYETQQVEEKQQLRSNGFDGDTTDTSSRPSLTDSIREAASQYEASKSEVDPWANEKALTGNNSNVEKSERPKSIAEKLGFINFDEEELDTPSYLRKDEGQNTSNETFRQLER
ncbi:cell division protein FtsZ [Halobacteriovorax sp. BALOs_7]|uniref:cell division protein FtsZ n=1 Tax=Halobacteriovorax sp. BALOs_7 TaxID=2109558 RepID=UPI000EA1A504|nr:cell division protein FtsZ [Halobacteriovorax sp. BALOs_7]AYF43121.1 cell division protein FtsZ [Halobacteriovorax sp. BALOs_7]